MEKKCRKMTMGEGFNVSNPSRIAEISALIFPTLSKKFQSFNISPLSCLNFSPHPSCSSHVFLNILMLSNEWNPLGIHPPFSSIVYLQQLCPIFEPWICQGGAHSCKEESVGKKFGFVWFFDRIEPREE